MALSINWLTRVVSVPQADLTPLGGGQYGLDIEWLRNTLKDIEDSDQGIVHPPTHRRNAPVLLSGVAYAQTFEVINGYTFTFETVGVPYVVVVSGGNHNLGDVTNFDGGMSLIVGNAAGLILSEGGAFPTAEQVAAAVWNHQTSQITTVGSIGTWVLKKLLSTTKFLAFR